MLEEPVFATSKYFPLGEIPILSGDVPTLIDLTTSSDSVLIIETLLDP
jgi:hypothetical protein